MGKAYDAIDDQLGAWIARQSLFIVSTAPLAADGHVNRSPKRTDRHAPWCTWTTRIADSCGYGKSLDRLPALEI